MHEPITIYANTRDAKIALAAFGSLVRQVVRTADSRALAEFAQAAGIITSPLYDTVIMNRLSGSYGDSPRFDGLLTNFFRRTGLTQLTNAQRKAAALSGHLYLRKMADAVKNRNGTARDTARAELRELGIPEADTDAFVDWLLQTDAMPDVGDLQQPQGRLFSAAVARFVDQNIQNPQKVDRPELASHPVGRLAYGLMSFSYAFHRNVTTRAVLRIGREADIRQNADPTMGRAQAVLRSLGAQAPTLAAYAGAIFGAQLVVTALREAIFNGDKWDEREKKGELADWLMSLAFSRTGALGPFDPVLQAITGLRYERDLSNIMVGPAPGYFLQATQNILSAAVGRNSANTNTAEWNAAKAAWQMLGVPMAAAALTAIPGGPFSGPLLGLGLQYATSNQTADHIASALVGEKETRRGARSGAAF